MKGYRSHLVNVLTALILILASPSVLGVLPPSWVPFLPAVQAVVAVIMRQLTTTPVGCRETEPIDVMRVD